MTKAMHITMTEAMMKTVQLPSLLMESGPVQAGTTHKPAAVRGSMPLTRNVYSIKAGNFVPTPFMIATRCRQMLLRLARVSWKITRPRPMCPRGGAQKRCQMDPLSWFATNKYQSALITYSLASAKNLFPGIREIVHFSPRINAINSCVDGIAAPSPPSARTPSARARFS